MLKNEKVKEEKEEVSKTHRFTYDFGYVKYDVSIKLTEWDDCEVNIEQQYNYDRNDMFVLNPSYKDHLELMAYIYEKVCELSGTKKAPKQGRRTKASGKAV